MKIDEILIKPMVTEKGSNLAKNKVYMFEVNLKSNKHKVKQVIEKLYKVKVANIKIMNRKGKKRRVGRKMIVKNLPDKKIAFIKLSEGKIDLFPQT